MSLVGCSPLKGGTRYAPSICGKHIQPAPVAPRVTGRGANGVSCNLRVRRLIHSWRTKKVRTARSCCIARFAARASMR
ncbi:protein of unknown function [Burkholderia multivorans]